MGNKTNAAQAARGIGTATLVAVGGLAMLAGWTLVRQLRRSRRYADHEQERRRPMSLFTSGPYPRRRNIDRSGQHPLFERRQSVYSQY